MTHSTKATAVGGARKILDAVRLKPAPTQNGVSLYVARPTFGENQ